MRALQAADIIALWDSAGPLAPGARALAILAAGCPEASEAELAALPLGARDARLLALRSHLMGQRIAALADCDACGETVEVTLTAERLGMVPGQVPETAGEHRLDLDGREVRLRLLTAGDIAAAEAGASAETVRERLLARAVIGPDDSGLASADDDLAAAIEAELERLDPWADVRLAVDCPVCGAGFTTTFDPCRFFWDEICALAVRLMGEVADLARTYHWSERDILAMSPARRRFYLEAAGT